MAREQMPVTPALITWARERAGYSLEDATHKFKNIAAWEDVDLATRPTYPQLEAMAEAFKVPVAVFFFPSPPALPPIEETFRTLPQVELTNVEPRVKLLLRKAKTLQLNLAELNGNRNPAARLITRDLHFPVNVDASTMAQRVREYLGVTIEQQAAWPTVEVALERWRARFVSVGVFVFKDQFRSDRFAGFCLTDEEFPIVYVNNTATKARQIFTLFHELAHLLFHTSGVDFRRADDAPRPGPILSDANRIEILTNRFAGTFLVPDDAFLATLAGRPPTYETARALADHFKVSTLVIFRKFRDHRLIDTATYANAHRQSEAEREPGSGGNFYNNQMAYLGRAYIGMALTAYHQHRISETELAEYLLVAPKYVAPIEQKFLKGAA